MVRRVLVATSLVAPLILSCAAILGLDDPVYVEDDGGAPSDPDDASTPEPSPCGVRPRGPVASDPGGDESKRYAFVMRSLDLGTTTPGFDLDNACTCASPSPDDVASCDSPAAVVCDDDGGVDNAFGRFIAIAMQGLAEQTMESVRKDANCGERSLLLLLERYNGLANDDNVTLFIVDSFGVDKTWGDAGCDPEDAGAVAEQEIWLSEKLFGESPIVTGFRGYVVDHRLVVDTTAQPANEMPLLPGLVLHAPIIEATLEERDAGFGLKDGLLAGRAGASDLVGAIGTTTRTGTNPPSPNCASNEAWSAAWDSVREQLCMLADIAIAPSKDGQGQRCDAISVVAGFTASPASVGGRRRPDAGEPPASCALERRRCD